MDTNSNLNQYLTIRTYVKKQTLRNISSKNEGISGQSIEEMPEPNENGTSVQSSSKENLSVILNNREFSHGVKNGCIDVLMNNNKNKLLEVRQQFGQQKRIEDCSNLENSLHADDNGTNESDAGSDEEQDLTFSGESQPTSEGEDKTTYYSSTNNAETSSISDETDLTLQANSDMEEDCVNFADDNEHWYVNEPTWKYVWKSYSDNDKTKGEYVWTKVKNENGSKEIYWGNIRNMEDEWIPQTVPIKEKRSWVPKLIAGKEHGETIWYYMMPYIPKTVEARKRTLEHIPQLIKDKGTSSWLSQLKFTKKGNKTVWYCKLTPAPEEPEDKKSISSTTTTPRINSNNGPMLAAAPVILPLPEFSAAKEEKTKDKNSNLPELRKIAGKPSQWFSKLIKDTDNTQEPKCSQATDVSSIHEPVPRNVSEEVRHNNCDGKKHNKLQLLENITPFSKEAGLKKKKIQTDSKSVWYKDILQESDDFHDKK
uniref:Uncharacterized protein n=1 Tax=Octopus bimaculoides TaxID=37653 RepID=A0A0L8I9I0_OCTBM